MTKAPLMSPTERENSIKFNQIKIFPLSKTEYESFVGYDIEFVDVAPMSKVRGIFYRKNSFYTYSDFGVFDKVENDEIVKRGIEAVLCQSIDFMFNPSSLEWKENERIFYGMPVRKKDIQERETSGD